MDVAILGASPNPTRYSHLAAERLTAAGHRAIGVNSTLPSIVNLEVVADVQSLPPQLHTLTVYVSKSISDALADAIVEYGFQRVIFNPGAENPALAEQLRATGVEVIEACTLVMLSTGEF
jgi:predicted CoA-binding protein